MSFVIVIDGPSGAGKSSTARAVARRLGIVYLDTGALYRALALRVLSLGVPPSDTAAVEQGAHDARIDLDGSPDDALVLLDGRDVSQEIRTPEVSEMASQLATLSGVRRELVERQRAFTRRGPLVAEGRDLGTVVFPEAQVKVFLVADLEERAERRALELKSKGLAVGRESVSADLQRRDERDRGRTDSPLKRADDAWVLDSTGLSLDQQVEAVLERVRAHPQCPVAWRLPLAGPRA